MSQTKAQLIEGSAASELTAAKTLLGAGSASAPSLTATGDTNTGIFFPTADTIAFAEGGAEALRVDSSGRLLVGTSSARSNFTGGTITTPLQIEGGAGATTGFSQTIIGANANPARHYFAKSRATTLGGNAAVINNDLIGVLSFQGNDGTNFIEAASITGAVDGTPGANDMPGRLVFSTTADGASSPTERMRIDNLGRVLINAVTNPSSVFFYVDGGANTIACAMNRETSNSAAQIQFRNTNGVVGEIRTSGTSTAYNTSSDHRLKENVVDLDGAIDRLKLLPVHRFNFIADPDTVMDGFIAHEAQEVVPEAVTGAKDEVDDEGNPVYQGIDQSKLVPLLTAALQEAVAKIESLEARLTAAGI